MAVFSLACLCFMSYFPTRSPVETISHCSSKPFTVWGGLFRHHSPSIVFFGCFGNLSDVYCIVLDNFISHLLVFVEQTPHWWRHIDYCTCAAVVIVCWMWLAGSIRHCYWLRACVIDTGDRCSSYLCSFAVHSSCSGMALFLDNSVILQRNLLTVPTAPTLRTLFWKPGIMVNSSRSSFNLTHGSIPMQRAFSKHLLCHKQHLHHWEEQKVLLNRKCLCQAHLFTLFLHISIPSN